MQENSQAVLLATGALPSLILVAAILTLPVCLALLALYRHAVLRSMARTSPDAASAAAAAPDATPTSVTPPDAPLRFETLVSAATTAAASSPLRAALRRSLQAASLIH